MILENTYYGNQTMKRRCFICLFALFLVGALTPILANDVPLHANSVLRFATTTEAQNVLSTPDRFIFALSPFDRQSRIETDRDVSEEEFLQFIKSHARDWHSDEIAKITRIATKVRQKLMPFQLPFPPTVVLIQTSGREEGGAAYCRGNAVVLPHEKIGESEDQLERLLTHELFHILSSHNPTWRQGLYKIVGFQSCSPIELPESLKHRKLTNPDAPMLDAFITLDVEGETVFAVPILFSKTERFDVKQGGPFFRYLTFRLMVIEQVEGKWLAAVDNREARMLQPSEIADFKRQIGTNTNYIIHPEEILAENFVHVVQQTLSLPSPHIVDELRRALSK